MSIIENTSILSELDIPYSPGMGGKEGLSALGYSRVYRSPAKESWCREEERPSGAYEYHIFFDKAADGGWRCGAYIGVLSVGVCNAMALSFDEMQACLRRMRELVAEVEE